MRGCDDVAPSSAVVGGDDSNDSAVAIEACVENEISNGFNSNQIVWAGFSQGGVIALELGLSPDHKMAGIMALSTYVHDHQRLTERVGFANIETPILMAHGINDPVIPITRAITSRQTLLDLASPVAWQEYAMGHQVCPQETTHIGQWLNQIYQN